MQERPDDSGLFLLMWACLGWLSLFKVYCTRYAGCAIVPPRADRPGGVHHLIVRIYAVFMVARESNG